MVLLISIVAFSLIFSGCAKKQESNNTPKAEVKKEEAPKEEGKKEEEVKKEESTKEEINYPTRPIKLVVPWAAGGSTDALARAFSAIAEKYLGQPLVVVNRTGAGGTIATTEVKAAKPDGYTIMINAVGVFTAQPVVRKVNYTIDDFEPIIGLSYEPIVLAVRADSPYKTFEDLKKETKTIKYASSGTGNFPHLAQAALFDKAGIKAEHVPCKGGAEAITTLLGGHVDVMAAHPGELLPYVESGKMRMLGIFSSERFEMIKDVPTFKEMGYDVEFSVWKFVLAPKGVDSRIIAKLADAFKAMMEDPEFVKFTENAHLTMRPISGEEVKRRLKKEAEVTAQVLKKLGLAKE